MTGQLTLSGQVLPVGGIAAKVLAAQRRGLARVILPEPNRTQVHEDLGDDLRYAVAVDYVTRVDELLDLALMPVPMADDAAAATSAGRVSSAAAARWIEPRTGAPGHCVNRRRMRAHKPSRRDRGSGRSSCKQVHAGRNGSSRPARRIRGAQLSCKGGFSGCACTRGRDAGARR